MTRNFMIAKQCTPNAQFSGKSLLIAILLLALLCLFGQVHSQSRSLVNVTTQQFPADLPKLTNGAQAWGDYNKDGRQDLLITGDTHSGYIARLYQNTTSGFVDVSSALLYDMPGVVNGTVNWIDYDGDTWPDLFVTGWAGSKAISRLFHNDRNNHFTDVTAILLPGLPGLSHSAVSWADYDGDKNPDLIVSGSLGYDNSQGTFSRLYLQKKDHSGFIENTKYFPDLPQLSNSAISSTDFNGDQFPELLITGNGEGGEYISKFYLSAQNRIYSEVRGAVPSLPGLSSGTLASGDYDRDGRADLMVTGQKNDGSMFSKLYHNKEKWANFEEVNTNFPGIKRGKATWADYDRDGRPDLLLTGNPGIFKLYRNTTTGFVDVTAAMGFHRPLGEGSIAWGDYDKDGYPDLFYSGIYDYTTPSVSQLLYLYHNNKGQSFSDVSSKITKAQGYTTDPSRIPYVYGFASWIDYRHSGSLDLMFMGEARKSNTASTPYATTMFFINENQGENFTYTHDQKQNKRFSIDFPYAFDQTAVDGNYQPSLFHGSADWADYDGDSLPDLIYTGQTEPLSATQPTRVPYTTLLHNNGVDDFMTNAGASILPSNCPGLTYSSVAWGDYDNDGYPVTIKSNRPS